MIKLITHTDLDGIGCEILVKHLFNDVDVSRCDYNNINEVVEEVINSYDKYTGLIITDISISKEVADKLALISDKITIELLDHHHTSMFLNQYKFATIKEYCHEGKTCGTKLVYDRFYFVGNTELVSLVENIRRYDTWEWKEKYNDRTPKRLNDLLYILGADTFVDLMLNKLETGEEIFDDKVNMILDLKQKEINAYIEKKNKMLMIKNLLGYKAGVVFADSYLSELGNNLAEMHKDLDFIVMINQTGISYRTIKPNINVGVIAKYFGGGGHMKASGNPMNKTLLHTFIDKLFE